MGGTLFAGPFVGEFGMELFTWQSHIRSLSRSFEKTIVSSRPAHEFLYRDFCDEFIPYDPQSYHCDGYECLDHPVVDEIHKDYNPDRVVRTINLKSYLNEIRNTDQEFFSFRKKGIKLTYNNEICICVRNFKKGADTKVERNWDLENCKQVVDYLLSSGYRVSSVGVSDTADHIVGTEDKRDISLEDLSEVLSASKFVMGPSSGLMHFASLCECPQVTWGESHLKKRYEKEWNPFSTLVAYHVDKIYEPSVGVLIKMIDRMVKNENIF